MPLSEREEVRNIGLSIVLFSFAHSYDRSGNSRREAMGGESYVEPTIVIELLKDAPLFAEANGLFYDGFVVASRRQ